VATQRQDAEALCGGSVNVCSPFSGAAGIVLVYAPPQRVLNMDSAATSSSLAADVGDDIGGKHHSVFFVFFQLFMETVS
jgi:hypothetical protein